MNKIIPAAILLVVLVGIGGYVACSNYIKPNLTSNSSNTASQKTSTNMFSSIKDAMSKSISLECEYNDNTGRTTKVYIKAGAVRSDSQNGEETDNVIMKDNKLYVWNNKQTQGTVIDFSVAQKDSTVSGMTNPQSSGSSDIKGENFMKDLEAQKQHCKPSLIADSLFTIPSNITFLDLGSMMKANSTGAPINYQQYMQNPPSMPKGY